MNFEQINDWKNWKGICIICNNKINMDKERYVNLRDFNGKKFESEVFYHLNCWKDRFKITQLNIQKNAEGWLNAIKNNEQVVTI